MVTTPPYLRRESENVSLDTLGTLIPNLEDLDSGSSDISSETSDIHLNDAALQILADLMASVDNEEIDLNELPPGAGGFDLPPPPADFAHLDPFEVREQTAQIKLISKNETQL